MSTEKEKAALEVQIAQKETSLAVLSAGNKDSQDKMDELSGFEYLDLFMLDLFCDEHGTPYATINCNGHREHWPIRGSHFKEFVVRYIFEKEGKPPTDQVLNGLVRLYTARAKFEGTQNIKTHLRCSRENGKLFIDLCNPKWESLVISKKSIKVMNPPIVFRRYGHMKPLKVDLEADPSDIEMIFRYVPISNDRERLLFKVGIVLNFVSDIPRVISLFYGPQGSGKSTVMKMERKVIDPSSIELLSMKTNEGELAQQANHHYLCFFDNVTILKKYISDLICRIVTGEGTSKRALYTDDEDVIFTMKRKVGLNGINIAGTEPDFLDRSITYKLGRIPKTSRKTEKELWNAFNEDQPRITGAICKILKKTLSVFPEIQLKELPRMADYALWGEAVSRAMGEAPGVFIHAFWQNVGNLNREAIESSPVGLAIMEFMRGMQEWEGTATELLNKLDGVTDTLKIDINARSWPKAANHLTRKINEIATNLSEEGIKHDYNPAGDKRTHKFTVLSSPNTGLVADGKRVTDPSPRGVGKDGKGTVTFELPSSAPDSEKKSQDDKDDKQPKSFVSIISEEILELVRGSDGISEEILFSRLQSNHHDLSRTKFDDIISKLKTQGIIFEVSPGKLKAV